MNKTRLNLVTSLFDHAALKIMTFNTGRQVSAHYQDSLFNGLEEVL
jgi:hypothetical protein